MINRYSLADHKVVITLPENVWVGGSNVGGTVFEIGGPGNNGQDGSFMGSITVRRSTATWTTEGDATGSWVHNKSLNRTGSVDLSIRQVSDDVIRLQLLARAFENDQTLTKGCLIQVYSGANQEVAKAEDCYITQIPDLVLGDTAANRDFSWTAGRVNFLQPETWPTTRV